MASGEVDELKGRVKEAAGALTGDQKLKREGKADQFVGKVKQNVDRRGIVVKARGVGPQHGSAPLVRGSGLTAAPLAGVNL